MSSYSRITLATFFLLAAIFIVAGCQTGSDSKAGDKTKQVTVEVTGMT